MRRLATTFALVAALAFPVAASAYPGENRNAHAVFSGPHCHFVTTAPTRTRAYPSHRAHALQIAHRPGGPVFAATSCPS
jgi:hypothetical protein